MIKIPSHKNFCRVFELPLDYPHDFCFGGGHTVAFRMVDWFEPIPMEDIHNSEDGYFDWDYYVPKLKEFLKVKNYIRPTRQYIAITDFGESFIFTGEGEER